MDDVGRLRSRWREHADSIGRDRDANVGSDNGIVGRGCDDGGGYALRRTTAADKIRTIERIVDPAPAQSHPSHSPADRIALFESVPSWREPRRQLQHSRPAPVGPAGS